MSRADALFLQNCRDIPGPRVWGHGPAGASPLGVTAPAHTVKKIRASSTAMTCRRSSPS